MDEILNELGLPNEIGFEISKNTIKSLLTSEGYASLIEIVKSKLICGRQICENRAAGTFPWFCFFKYIL